MSASTSPSSRPTSYTTIATDPATVRRKTVTRVDIEHAIDARENAWGDHIRAARKFDPQISARTSDAYVDTCTTLRELLDRWEYQLRGWEEGA
jgi:hypothetical protein